MPPRVKYVKLQTISPSSRTFFGDLISILDSSRMVHAKPKPTPNPSTQKISNKSSKGKPPKIQSDTSSNGKTSSYSQATANPNIHRERAKRWGTNPFMAEWFANAVEYMKAPKAQLDFEDWCEHSPSNFVTRVDESLFNLTLFSSGFSKAIQKKKHTEFFGNVNSLQFNVLVPLLGTGRCITMQL